MIAELVEQTAVDPRICVSSPAKIPWESVMYDLKINFATLLGYYEHKLIMTLLSDFLTNYFDKKGTRQL